MAEIKNSSTWYPFLAMVVVDLAFAVVNILLKKVVDGGINHLVFITYRQAVAALFLAPIGYFWERNTRPKLTLPILCHLFVSGIVGASLTQYLFLIGIQYTSATFSCAFVNIVPVITFVMALPFGLEKLNLKASSGKSKAIGTVVCIGGAILLITYKGMPLFHHLHPQVVNQTVAHHLSPAKRKAEWTLGSMLMIVATFLWSSWFLIQSSIGQKFPCQYSSTAIMNFFAAIQSAVLTLCINRDLSIWALKGKTEVFSVLFAGIVVSGLCFVAMSWCVKQRGPVFTAAFSPFVQIMSGMLDIPLLHEQLNLGSLLGSTIVIIGLYMLLWGKNKEMKNGTTKVSQETEETKEQNSQIQVITVTDSDSQPIMPKN